MSYPGDLNYRMAEGGTTNVPSRDDIDRVVSQFAAASGKSEDEARGVILAALDALAADERHLLDRFLRWWISYYGRHADLSSREAREAAITEGLDEFLNLRRQGQDLGRTHDPPNRDAEIAVPRRASASEASNQERGPDA